MNLDRLHYNLSIVLQRYLLKYNANLKTPENLGKKAPVQTV